MSYIIKQAISSKTFRRSTKLNQLKRRQYKFKIFCKSKINNNKLARNNRTNRLISYVIKKRKERLFKIYNSNALNSLN